MPTRTKSLYSGDNLDGRGLGGAAKLRYHKQAIGFITKKHPDDEDESFLIVRITFPGI